MATSKQKNPLLLPKIHNHILRHTFVTRLNEANLNAKAIQAILGHKDIQTTMDIYTDATDILLHLNYLAVTKDDKRLYLLSHYPILNSRQ